MDNERGTVRSARAGVHRRAAPAVAGPCGDLRSAGAARSEPGPPRSRRPAVDPPAARAVHEAGYDHACAIAHSPLTGRLALPRSYVGDHDGAWRLRAKEVRHRLRGTVTELRRTTARRAAG
ncbi:hypothetical protein ACIRS1_23790 [Kitasatospora sp. NPDC101176]|uniref:hypothetical protein n=1 Tax=Kitasatospora sp. NPDC101176 TaxID=3364099 RepID=UPI0037FD87CC